MSQKKGDGEKKAIFFACMCPALDNFGYVDHVLNSRPISLCILCIFNGIPAEKCFSA